MSVRALHAIALVVCLLVAGCGAPTASPAAEAIGGVDAEGEAEGASRTASPATAPARGSPTRPASVRSAATDQPESPEPSEPSTSTDSENRPTDPSPDTLAEGYDVEVVGGDLPVDYPIVFARVAVLLDRPAADAPGSVVVRPPERMRVGRQRYPEFYRLVGIEVPEGEATALTAAAYVATPETVTVNREILNDTARTESTLAHESVHVVQFRGGTFSRLDGTAATPPGSTDRLLVRTAVVEGSATYVQREYVRRYVSEGPDPVASLARLARNRSAATRLGIAPYVAGARYVENRVDDPSDLASVYDTPPRTTEELLHGLDPGSEPVASLTVRDDPGDGWEADFRSRDTQGELFLRVVMGTELNESAAADAADGWGNDVRLAFTPEGVDGEGVDDGATGYAWVVRFDDEANATAFESAFETWRDGRGADAAPVRLVRVSPETVAVLVGAESFVRDAGVTGTDGSVTVTVNDRE